MRNKEIAEKILLQAGELKHIVNELTEIESDICDDIWLYDVKGLARFMVVPYNDPEFGVTDKWIHVTPNTRDRKSTYITKSGRKATRKLYVALVTDGLEGVMRLLEKKNAALRALMWKEVNNEDWEP